MRVFFDSSAFAKRYLLEADSDFTIHWCNQATELALSVIAIPELIAAFCRLRRENKLNEKQYRQIKEEMLTDIVDALIIDTTSRVLAHATRALEEHCLRGMDALHIGAAIACEADVFITADIRQREAAQALGVTVVAP